VFGVLGQELVAASRTERAAGIASEATRTVPGAQGALVFTVDARELASRVLAGQLEGLAALGAPLVVRPLGDLSGWAEVARTGVRGHVRLTVR
jgi:hypothetical protein